MDGNPVKNRQDTGSFSRRMERAAAEYAHQKKTLPGDGMNDALREAFEAGANFAIGCDPQPLPENVQL